jgi:hypothetical protein
VFIELIDLLRCVNPHEDSWLVASFRNITDRFVIEGTLGCPICSAQYEIAGGVADFSGGVKAPTDVSASNLASDDLAMQAGAFLNATQPGATIVLGGVWADAAEKLGELADVRVIAINAGPRVRESERIGLVRVDDRIPLAAGSVHGAALDASFSTAMIEAAAAAVKPGGRLVGPAGREPSPPMSVLARDARHWVAEKHSEVHPLTRARPAR